MNSKPEPVQIKPTCRCHVIRTIKSGFTPPPVPPQNLVFLQARYAFEGGMG